MLQSVEMTLFLLNEFDDDDDDDDNDVADLFNDGRPAYGRNLQQASAAELQSIRRSNYRYQCRRAAAAADNSSGHRASFHVINVFGIIQV